jgi:tripartite-type tricarboxylate transporter receptor subunit TctC
MITRRRLIAVSAATALTPGLFKRDGWAQEGWPSRPVRLIIPFPPGGGNDVVGRILTPRLTEMWGQQVIIENRGGAGSNIGAELAAKAPADGYTIFFGSFPLAVNPFIYPKLAYDAAADFAPITLICTFPNLLVVPPDSPLKSVADLLAHAKAKPGDLTFGSAGVGTSLHLSGELFVRTAGIQMTHIPYRGAGPAITDLIGGRLTMMFSTAASLMGHVRAGRVRALAVSSAKRFSALPELPTVAESGVPGFDVSSWYALFAPAKVPPAIVQKINTDAVAAMREPQVRERLVGLGLEVAASTPQELGAFFRAEIAKWGPVIKAAGITAQ